MVEHKWKDNEDFNKMRDIFNSMLPNSLYDSHYELAEKTPYNASQWQAFLTDPAVVDFITKEIKALNQRELRRLIRDASTGKSKSVGTAQMVTALTRVLENSNHKEGTIFVYSYVPLNTKESTAPNVSILKENPFKK
jgi:hypothetical protein